LLQRAIARSWSGTVPAARADDFAIHLMNTGVAEAGAIDGCERISILRRSEGDRVRFVMISYWRDEQALRCFARDQVDEAVLYPGDELFRLEADEQASNYELIYDEAAG
jgi:heme-degrading monooxygenase HmoA